MTKNLTIQFAQSGLGVYNVTGGNFVNEDTSTAENFPTVIDMGGGATKIVPNKGNFTLNNYDPSTGVGIQVNDTSDIMRSISNGNITFGDSQFSFGGTTVNFANPNSNDSTMINLYNNQGKKQKVSYTHSDVERLITAANVKVCCC